jgi:hypothetical protein
VNGAKLRMIHWVLSPSQLSCNAIVFATRRALVLSSSQFDYVITKGFGAPGHTDEGYSDSHGKLLHCDQSINIRLLIVPFLVILYVSGVPAGVL